MSALKLPGGFQPACFAFIPLVFCTTCPISCLPSSTLPFPKNHVPDYPPVQLYLRETAAFQWGVSDFHLEEGNIRAHDPEKTVSNLFRLRAKTGEAGKEVVKNYPMGSGVPLGRPGRQGGGVGGEGGGGVEGRKIAGSEAGGVLQRTVERISKKFCTQLLKY
jgi:hypothetical protein